MPGLLATNVWRAPVPRQAPAAGPNPTVREYLDNSTDGGSFSLITGAGTAIDDVLVLFHACDTGAASAMTAPTGTAGTWTEVRLADLGSGNSHLKLWTRPVTVAGAQTVTLPASTGEVGAALYVIAGADPINPIDDSAATTGTASTSHIASSVSPTSTAALLLAAVLSEVFTSSTYSAVSGGMTNLTEEDMSPLGIFCTLASARQNLSASGPTGTRTFTYGTSNAFAAVTVAIRPGIVHRTATVAESASATSITGTLPTDRVAGDLVVASFHMSTTVANFTGPGGSWVQLVAPTASAGAQIVAVYYQFDPGSAPVGTTSGAADRQTCICQAYGNVDPVTPVDVAAVTATAAGTPLAVGGITTATPGARLISGATVNASTGTWTLPTGMALVAQHTSGTGRGGAVADQAVVAGATGTRTWVWSGAGLAMVGYLAALRPRWFAGGGGSFPRAADDTSASTDAAARVKIGPRSAADTSASTDVAARQVTEARAAADTSASTDVAVGSPSKGRAAADTSASTDVAVRSALAFARAAADTAAATDAAPRVSARQRAAADTSVSTDAATRTSTRPRGSADSSAAGDATPRVLILARSTADASTSTDSATGTVNPAGGAGRQANDTSASTDVAARSALSFARAASDMSAASDVAPRVVARFKAAADSAVSTDTAVRQLGRFRVAADASLAGDVASRVLRAARAAADTSASSDAATGPGLPSTIVGLRARYVDTTSTGRRTSDTGAGGYTSDTGTGRETSNVGTGRYVSDTGSGRETSGG